ncbi:hypothetical protein IV203_006461 [Nitzschia inconspicua]|uniref:Uncharacterized protein n=1 Tax=Nitzschia inconspicua TaxID=303405 RepID=A0A9K3KAM9_9STRA|nr:hypothetical protein IV203_006461 [Nitzschia inconspicua]
MKRNALSTLLSFKSHDRESILRLVKDFQEITNINQLHLSTGPLRFAFFQKCLSPNMKDERDVVIDGKPQTSVEHFNHCIKEFIKEYFASTDLADQKNYSLRTKKPYKMTCTELSSRLRYINSLMRWMPGSHDQNPLSEDDVKTIFLQHDAGAMENCFCKHRLQQKEDKSRRIKLPTGKPCEETQRLLQRRNEEEESSPVTTAMQQRKKTKAEERIKIGCRVKIQKKNLFHLLVTDQQKESLNGFVNQNFNCHGTIKSGNAASGYKVAFDNLPYEDKEVFVKRKNLTAVGSGKDETPYDKSTDNPDVLETIQRENRSKKSTIQLVRSLPIYRWIHVVTQEILVPGER